MNTQTQEALKMAMEEIKLTYIKHNARNSPWLQNKTYQACKEALASNSEALAQPAQDDNLMTGTWIRYNDGDDNKRLALELDIAMNGVDGAAKSPALIDVLAQAVNYFNKQPAQEPVAWMDEEGIWQYEWESHSDNKKPLYTHPVPSWQGLSDGEILDKAAQIMVERHYKDKNK